MSVVTVQPRTHFWFCVGCADGLATPRPREPDVKVPAHCECCLNPMPRVLAVSVSRKALRAKIKMDFEDYLDRRFGVTA